MLRKKKPGERRRACVRSNRQKKMLVQQGKLCYICEQRPPDLINRFGGAVCHDCHNHMQKAMLQRSLSEGYSLVRRDSPLH